MKYCEHCGHQLPDYAAFCENCGTRQTMREQTYYTTPASNTYTSEDEARFLIKLQKMLRAEHLAWKIGSIANVCLMGTLILAVILLAASDFSFSSLFRYFSSSGSNLDIDFSLNSFALTVPGIIIGFIMASKTARLHSNIRYAPAPALDRCGSVGTIVLGALFNEVALIFIIINFVRCKSNKALLEQIRQRRSVY